jgi:hypothetical protein
LAFLFENKPSGNPDGEDDINKICNDFLMTFSKRSRLTRQDIRGQSYKYLTTTYVTDEPLFALLKDFIRKSGLHAITLSHPKPINPKGQIFITVGSFELKKISGPYDFKNTFAEKFCEKN